MRRLTTSKTMKRLLLVIFMGLVMSVEVAWIAFIKFDVPTDWWDDDFSYKTSHNGISWSYKYEEGKTFVTIARRARERKPSSTITLQNVPWWSGVQVAPGEEKLRPHTTIVEEAWGWPMVCMVSILNIDRIDNTPVSSTIISGIPVGTRKDFILGPSLLPVKPIWFGLFANTMFYAFVPWILLKLWDRKQVWLKKERSLIKERSLTFPHRKLCLGCKYLLDGLLSETCPECGRGFDLHEARTFKIDPPPLIVNNPIGVAAIYILPQLFVTLLYPSWVSPWWSPLVGYAIVIDDTFQNLSLIIIATIIQWSIIILFVCGNRLRDRSYRFHLFLSFLLLLAFHIFCFSNVFIFSHR